MNRSLIVLLAVYFSVACLYALATPPFEASDEVFHYPFVRNIALGRGLPVQRLDVKQPWEQVAFHPPAYYYAAAALTFGLTPAISILSARRIRLPALAFRGRRRT